MRKDYIDYEAIAVAQAERDPANHGVGLRPVGSGVLKASKGAAMPEQVSILGSGQTREQVFEPEQYYVYFPTCHVARVHAVLSAAPFWHFFLLRPPVATLYRSPCPRDWVSRWGVLCQRSAGSVRSGLNVQDRCSAWRAKVLPS